MLSGSTSSGSIEYLLEAIKFCNTAKKKQTKFIIEQCSMIYKNNLINLIYRGMFLFSFRHSDYFLVAVPVLISFLLFVTSIPDLNNIQVEWNELWQQIKKKKILFITFLKVHVNLTWALWLAVLHESCNYCSVNLHVALKIIYKREFQAKNILKIKRKLRYQKKRNIHHHQCEWKCWCDAISLTVCPCLPLTSRSVCSSPPVKIIQFIV